MRLLIYLIGCIVFTCITASAQVTPEPTLVPYTDGILSIDIPLGWEVTTRPGCPSYLLSVVDPNSSNRTSFGLWDFGFVVYTNNAYKERDIRHARMLYAMGAMSEEEIISTMSYINSPVVKPCTPENYLTTLLKTNPNCTDVKILSTKPLQKFFPYYPADAIHCVAIIDGEVNEGVFEVRLKPALVSAFGGLGSSYPITYMYAPQTTFHSVAPLMQQSFSTATLSQEYVERCMQALRLQGQISQQISQTLGETSDIIWDVYQQRDRSEDILGAQWGDTSLGYIRIYDETTGAVYRVDQSWYYGVYDPGRDQYSMSGLYPLTGDQTDLYLKPPLMADEIG